LIHFYKSFRNLIEPIMERRQAKKKLSRNLLDMKVWMI